MTKEHDRNKSVRSDTNLAVSDERNRLIDDLAYLVVRQFWYQSRRAPADESGRNTAAHDDKPANSGDESGL